MHSLKLDWPKLALIAILLFSYSTRIWRLSFPPEYYFDEVYHAFTAEAYSRNDPKGYEWWHQAPDGVAYEWLHPPVAKLFQGFSIKILGNTSFAWRLPSALFGTLVIGAIYQLGRVLSKDRKAGLLAALIASFEGLLLVQSRIAMNDIFVTFFILLACVFHWKYLTSKKSNLATRYLLLAGLAAGFAMASKWSGVFVLLIFGLSELLLFATNKKFSKFKRLMGVVFVFEVIPAIILGLLLKNMLFLTKGEHLEILTLGSSLLILEMFLGFWALGYKKFTVLFVSLVVLPITVYVASFGQFWLQLRTNNLLTFRDLHHQIWWYQTHLEAHHPWESRPQQWMLNLKPVWYHVDYEEKRAGNIFALANPSISWLGLLSMMALTLWGTYKRKWQYLYLFVAYVSVWTPWFASPRIMFFYHYTPAMALLSVSLGLACWELLQTKAVVGRILAVAIIMISASLFVYFYPFWTGFKIPIEWINQYYWFPSWKP